MPPLASQETIDAILDCRTFAVVGASRDRNKFGYQVFRSIRDAGYTVYPVNPNADLLDGCRVFAYLDDITESIDCAVTVVPSDVTEDIVSQAARLGIPYLWMQPGSESEDAIVKAEEAGIIVVSRGPCIMVEIAVRARRSRRSNSP